MSKPKTAITPTREENYPEWYQQVVKHADLAEASPVRGCMVIKPWGYALWEAVQRILDARIKETGHENAYFPLFIPKSYLEKEAEHVEGFAKECAVVTHSRLEADADGKLQPAGALEEPLIVRPTSETIIGEMYSKWVESYRDLPVLINQWCNVVRWEMRTRLFLRTAEFLWQEGHTAHATKEEALEETHKMHQVYKEFAEGTLAMPVLCGAKSDGERFPGAEETLTIEAMMQDTKALQAGTSHYLGQNFAKAADIQFLDEDGKRKLVHTTSWGVSTRLIGGMIMTHSDDDGLVLPPKMAPAHVVILPITRKPEDEAAVFEACDALAAELKAQTFNGEAVRVKVDKRDIRGGEKNWQWVKKGVPLRVEIGPRDIEAGSVFLAKRTESPKDKQSVPQAEFVQNISATLADMQATIFNRALAFRQANTHTVETKEAFEALFAEGGKGGFALAHWCGCAELEDTISKEMKVSIRCIPLPEKGEALEAGTCIFTGKPSKQRVVFARAY